MKRVFIAAATRTAIGGFGGTLVEVSPVRLGVVPAKEALTRALVADGAVDEVIVGNVLGAGHGMNIARQISIGCGLPVTTPAYTVNKVCGSGLKAITLAASAIASGEAQCVLAGGVESMSLAPFVSHGTRWGARLGHTEMRDLILQDGLTDVFGGVHMGITAENLAQKYGIGREEQDAFAASSQSKVQAAQERGDFSKEIVPVVLERKGKEPIVFAKDEYPRAGTTVEALAKLRPAFKKDGTVTAGNASGINDGGAVVVLVSEERMKSSGASALAEVVGWASGGVSPDVMGIGPVEAVRKVCAQTGVALDSVKVIEANEAFAVQSLAVNKLLGWAPERVNAWGGAVALGHPIGASGARICVTLISRLNQITAQGEHYGIATLCIGGGQGIAIMLRINR